MPFTEICIYQVKPQKVEEFEALMLEAKKPFGKTGGIASAPACQKRVSHRHGTN